MALYFECRISKNAFLPTVFWRFCPLGNQAKMKFSSVKPAILSCFFGNISLKDWTILVQRKQFEPIHNSAFYTARDHISEFKRTKLADIIKYAVAASSLLVSWYLESKHARESGKMANGMWKKMKSSWSFKTL